MGKTPPDPTTTRRISPAKVVPAGCRPSTIASDIFGASRVSRGDRIAAVGDDD